MKKFLLIILVFFSFSHSVFSQNPADILATIGRNQPFEREPVLKKGSHVFQAGYGFPNKLAQYLDFGGIADIFSGSGTSKSSFGPLGVQYEFMINNQSGIGATLGYAYATQTYDLRIPFIGTQIDNISGTIHQWQLGLTASYHFFTADKIDAYGRAGIGANLWSGRYENAKHEEMKKMEFPTPFNYQGLIGLRYLPTEQFGFFVEGNYNNINSFVNLGLVYHKTGR